MGDLLDYGLGEGFFKDQENLVQTCREIVARLLQGGPVAELDALAAISGERDFETVAKAVREAIEKNTPEAGLDRLHTFVVKYVRMLCIKHGLSVTREKPLHSLFGEYVRRLREDGHIESRMAELILKSSISVLEAFNDVRNNWSLAHDNIILDYDEALLIFNHVASSIRFLKSLESKIQNKRAQSDEAFNDVEDVPF
jgi:Abortive infection C-terminus